MFGMGGGLASNGYIGSNYFNGDLKHSMGTFCGPIVYQDSNYLYHVKGSMQSSQLGRFGKQASIFAESDADGIEWQACTAEEIEYIQSILPASWIASISADWSKIVKIPIRDIM